MDFTLRDKEKKKRRDCMYFLIIHVYALTREKKETDEEWGVTLRNHHHRSSCITFYEGKINRKCNLL